MSELTLVAGACEQDARLLLTQRGVTVERIVQVNPDCILYVAGGRAHTAWVRREDDRLLVRCEAGFPAYEEA